MLTNDPTSSDAKRRHKPVTAGVIAFLTLAFLVVLFLRHDWWNWTTPKPLLFGILPIGLWWQALVSILASVLMWLMVRFAWPDHLEDVVAHNETQPDASASPSANHNSQITNQKSS